jgi:hypothetical protein
MINWSGSASQRAYRSGIRQSREKELFMNPVVEDYIDAPPMTEQAASSRNDTAPAACS